MWGEDSSGRKVSLLNNDTTTTPSSLSSTTTTTTTTTSNKYKFSRPPLPARSRGSEYSSSSSIASSNSWSSFQCSSRSSFSRSPGHSPPTPPLTRFDSLSTIGTASSSGSPMNSSFGFEPTDPKHQVNHTLPYYGNLNKAIPVPGQDPTQPSPYYHLPGQQPLPPIGPLDLEDPYPHPNALHKIQTSPNGLPVPTSLSPTAQPHLISPTQNLLATTIPTLQTTSLPTAPIPDPINNPASASTPSSSSKAAAGTSTSNKAPTTPSNNPTGPKKKYPCPHAATFNCTDTFTTSGHAARHGKKHTGEKNVHCPTCNKAFTRKDNMKQHERTHKGGHGGSTSNAGINGHAVGMVGTPTSASTRGASSSSSASPSSKTMSSSAPTTATTTTDLRSRRTSTTDPLVVGMSGPQPSAATIAPGDAMDLDILPTASHSRSPSVPNGMGVAERPKMPRSELSEILENVNNAGLVAGLGGATLGAEELVNAAAMAAPGGVEMVETTSGDSPLDALAIAAASGAVV